MPVALEPRNQRPGDETGRAVTNTRMSHPSYIFRLSYAQ